MNEPGVIQTQRFNFLGLDEPLSSFDSSKVVILPVPYEQTVSYRSGTRGGPGAIIDASRYVELFDLDLKADISAIGIHTFEEVEPVMTGPKEMTNNVFDICSSILLKDKFLILLGGEHSLSIGSALAHTKKYDELTVLQFDAHLDLRDSYQGTTYSHASAMRRISEFANTVHVGIRSACEEEYQYIKKNNTPVFFAEDIGGKNKLIDILDLLSENIYITFDMDSLDPSIMPAVGTPEPGGLLWYETIEILKGIAEKKNIIGFDMVELAPIPGNISSDFLAAKLIYKLIGYIFK